MEKLYKAFCDRIDNDQGYDNAKLAKDLIDLIPKGNKSNLDLVAIEKRLDNALNNETVESLSNYIHKRKLGEKPQ